MARPRVKKRTQPKPGDASFRTAQKVPKSMVIRIGAGEVGPAISQLVKDVREVMQPHTASRLKERKANKLRDYTTMAGPLGVTHLFLFSRSENGNVNMRLALTPRGPTLHFRVSDYSLCKDIVTGLKKSKSVGQDHLASPLLVMNNFTSKDEANSVTPKHLESLTTTVFQSLFAPINPQVTPLKSIRRILLLDRQTSGKDDSPFVLNFRHYDIATPIARSSQARGLRKLNTAAQASHPTKKRLPNLGRLGDVSDLLLDPSTAAGFTSASESEMDTDAEVKVLAPTSRRAATKDERQAAREAQRARIEANGPLEETDQYRRKPSERVQKKAIKLTELGPRMTLRLTKVEEGMCGGKVMWHEYIHKTKAEQAAQEKMWAQRQKVKDERKRVQKENIERKKKEKRANGNEDDLDGDEMAEIMNDDDDFWDDEDGNEQDEDEMEVEVE